MNIRGIATNLNQGFRLLPKFDFVQPTVQKVNDFISEKLNDPVFVKRLAWGLVIGGTGLLAATVGIALATKFLPVGLAVLGVTAISKGIYFHVKAIQDERAQNPLENRELQDLASLLLQQRA